MLSAFTLVDVFSDRPFGGNQLAVLPDARGISDQVMQQVAREFNFPETTFVLPPRATGHTHRVRIFTPLVEVPFAGHPTIGTAAALTAADPTSDEFVFEEGIGPVAVTMDGPSIQMHVPTPTFDTSDATPPTAAIASALSLPVDAIVESWYGGVGLPFTFIRLTDSDTVDKAVLDRSAWEAGLNGTWSPHLYFFAGDIHNGGQIHARFFAPGYGIDEDPATGSACASLVTSLALRTPDPDLTYQIRIDQGIAMGRPSMLTGSATKVADRVTETIVTGQAAIVATGTINLPR